MKVNDPFDRVYVGDWLRTFRGAPIRGPQDLYLNLRFLMHDSDRYGYLSMNGAPIPPMTIAAKLGLSLEQYTTLLRELEPYAVLDRTRNGTLFCPQMVEMRRRAEVFSKAGRKGGGNPHLKRKVNTSPDNDTDILSPPSSEKSTRETKPRDEIFDVVVELWYGGQITQPHRGIANRITADLKALGATPAEVRLRLARMKKVWADMPATGTSLVKNWHLFAAAPQPVQAKGDDGWKRRNPTPEELAIAFGGDE